MATDVVWNLASIVILGIGGLAVNILIARQYGAEVLGMFNLAFSVFVIMSQFAAGGFHYSVISQLPLYLEDRTESSSLISSALLLTAGLSALATLVTGLCSKIVAALLESPALSQSIAWMLPGLFCFALNKVLLAAVNSAGHMKFFAIAQSCRFLFIFLFVFAAALFSLESTLLPACFSVTELLLILGLTRWYFRYYHIDISTLSGNWAKIHFSFGMKAFPSGLLMDVNTKIDVLLLGYFANDKITGIYSFAALLSEGFAELPRAVMVNINPRLSGLVAENKTRELKRLVHLIRNKVMVGMAVLGTIAAILFAPVVTLLTGDEDMQSGHIAFIILAAGIVLSSGYSPFKMLLNQAGSPTMFTLYMALIVATNVVLNLVFIPALGMNGSALATAMAYVSSIFFLQVIARKRLKISL
jgi:O-antigen/teichoic acid export membrane protein